VEVASLNPRIAKNLKYRKEGEITPPIKINGKYFFFQLLEVKKPGDVKPVELVKDEIEMMLKARKKAEFRENLIKSLRSNYVIETFLSKLKSEVIN
jgi:parvulin-like peptidyl-prolyl isomerase